MKILVTGGTGLLGSNLIPEFQNLGHDVYHPTRQEMDITDEFAVIKKIGEVKPDIIVHCAAIAKFVVAESKPVETIDVNIIGTSYIVKECIKKNIRFIFISTSHVFDGEKGNYTIEDKVNPLTKYSKSKVAGEMLSLIHNNSLVVRTEFCESTFPFDVAFIDKYSSKEYIDVLVPKLIKKCLGEQTGICHLAGPRRSFYEFGKLRNPNVKQSTIEDFKKNSLLPILKDTSLISN